MILDAIGFIGKSSYGSPYILMGDQITVRNFEETKKAWLVYINYSQNISDIDNSPFNIVSPQLNNAGEIDFRCMTFPLNNILPIVKLQRVFPNQVLQINTINSTGMLFILYEKIGELKQELISIKEYKERAKGFFSACVKIDMSAYTGNSYAKFSILDFDNFPLVALTNGFDTNKKYALLGGYTNTSNLNCKLQCSNNNIDIPFVLDSILPEKSSKFFHSLSENLSEDLIPVFDFKQYQTLVLKTFPQVSPTIIYANLNFVELS